MITCFGGRGTTRVELVQEFHMDTDDYSYYYSYYENNPLEEQVFYRPTVRTLLSC